MLGDDSIKVRYLCMVAVGLGGQYVKRERDEREKQRSGCRE